MLPAASVAVALNVVDAFTGTETPKPGVPNVAAVPLARDAPEQSEVVYSRTVEPASALPKMLGLALLDGDAGVEVKPVGAAGAL